MKPVAKKSKKAVSSDEESEAADSESDASDFDEAPVVMKKPAPRNVARKVLKEESDSDSDA